MLLKREPVKSVTIQVKEQGGKHKSFSVYSTTVPKVFKIVKAAIQARAKVKSN